jgi:hypothetical protein
MVTEQPPAVGSIRQCVWCSKPMGRAAEGDPEKITHAICPACFEAVTAGIGKAGKA